MNVGTQQKVFDFIQEKQLIKRGERILLGLSGGADSVCLFRMLLEYQKVCDFSLRAVHVHHGMRETADRDVSFVEELCEKYQIFCSVRYENVPSFARENGLSLEEAGREVRYRIFREEIAHWKEEETEGSYKTAIAHHADDQAETVLFQVFRGSGMKGLCGIHPMQGAKIRPLLCLERKEIEDYLQSINQPYCQDETNVSLNYARNKIRNRVLPYVENEICNGAGRHICDMAKRMQELEEYIEKSTELAYQDILLEEKVFSVKAYLNLDSFLAKQVLLHALGETTGSRKDVSQIHVQAMDAFLKKGDNGSLDLPYKTKFVRSYDRFYFQKKEPEAEEEPRPELLMEEVSPKEFCESEEKRYTKFFDYDKIGSILVFRHRNTEDYMSLKKGHKRLKECFIDWKIPREERDRIWVLADNSHILWVPGYRISEFYKVTENTKKVLRVELKKEEENGRQH